MESFAEGSSRAKELKSEHPQLPRQDFSSLVQSIQT